MLVRNNPRRRFISVFALIAIALAFTITTPPTASAEPARQIVFSGAGINNFGAPFAFWIWCMADGNGEYERRCAGAVTVPLQGVRVGVQGFVTEEADGTYTMRVFSVHPGELRATLHNVEPEPEHGPSNTVEFAVTTPIRSFTGSSTTAIVIVSGPGD